MTGFVYGLYSCFFDGNPIRSGKARHFGQESKNLDCGMYRISCETGRHGTSY